MFYHEITPEDIVYQLVLQGKIDIATAIKFHMKELTLEEVIKLIKKDEILGNK